ncbi:MAG: nucleotidyltransferase domain-containing protein [archaeon]|nr:nucleotidyltransferase domain-containing protein [archaeon]
MENNHTKENKENNNREEIPEMNLDNKYSKDKPVIENQDVMKKEMEKTKKELEKLKNYITKKYSYTQAIGILPPQSIKYFIEEEDVPKETEKHIHLLVIVPEEKLKEIPKIKQDLVKQIEELKQKIWLHVKTPVDIWEICLDSKFELASAIAMSFPLYDKGILGALRVAEIHKSLVLRKFEKYVVSYVIAGSLVRGTAVKTSDVDIFIIINDTDVKRMPRLELKEKLRAIIYQYVAEASAIAGVKNKLSPQIYLLTDFWESVKDAHPVIFTFIRDGIPLYDRHTFMPWKALLKMGKLKPSPEAIDMFMSMGDKTVQRVKHTLMDMVLGDIYWGIITPSQALLMLYGQAPPTPKQTVTEMENIFVEKEKMLEKKYITILEKIVGIYKDYEHEKLKEIKGAEVDKLLEDSESYLKRLKELRVQIEKRAQEKTIEQIYHDTFELLKSMLGNKSESLLISEFEKQMIRTAKFPPEYFRILKNIVSARSEFKKGKSSTHKVEEARKNASILINGLIEYSQRCDMVSLEKGRMRLKYKESGQEKNAELLHFNNLSFLLRPNSIKKITDKIQDSNAEELSKEIESKKTQKIVEINPKIFELLKKELGDFEIIL